MRQRYLLSRRDLAAVSHPVRQRILDLLVEAGELSGRELVRRVPDAPSNPYYHLDVLRKAGLIEVVRTQRVRGATEKYYRALARTYSLDPRELLGVAGRKGGAVRSGIMAVARQGAENALDDLEAALESGATGGQSRDPFITSCTFRLSQREADALREQMKAWLEEAVAAGTAPDRSAKEDGAEYVFYQLFFPSDPE